MKRFIFLLLLTPSLALAHDPPPGSGYVAFGAAANAALKASCLNPARTGASVVELDTGRPVFAKNDDILLLPASVMKLFTTGAALYHLGPDYRFVTRALADALPVKGVVEGNLYLKGGGDPKLTPEMVWRMAAALKRRGVDRVTGDLVIDTTFFDNETGAPSWSAHRSTRAYDAKLSALSVSFNSVAVEVYPGEKEGAKAVVGLDPSSPYLALDNRAVTAKKGPKVTATRSGGGDRLTIRVAGSVAPGGEAALRYVNVPDPDRFAAESFMAKLIGEGIVVEGKIRFAKTPAKAPLLFAHESEPLRTILGQLNRFSNNFVAEQIVKTMAAEKTKAPGSHEAGLKLIRQFIKTIGADQPGTVLADGSGLSHENRVTATQVTRLIASVRERFDLGPDFIASLALMGAEGSVHQRLADTPIAKFARVKTGSLTGVSNLAGVVAAKDGRRFAFALMLNDNRCGYNGADRVEDAIVRALYRIGDQ